MVHVLRPGPVIHPHKSPITTVHPTSTSDKYHYRTSKYMDNNSKDIIIISVCPPIEATSEPPIDYAMRREALRRRVAEAARSLSDRGITPTVARVRAALGGGSPNDLAPALKEWKESFRPAPSRSIDRPGIPVQIADLAVELWQRATIAAAVDIKGGPTARALSTQSEEAEALRHQVKALRSQLERESILYGELRAQAARHEAIARDALARIEESEARERRHLRELGGARQRLAALDATINQLRERSVSGARQSSKKKTGSPEYGRPKPARRSAQATKRTMPQRQLKRKAHPRLTPPGRKPNRKTPKSKSRR